MATSNPYPWEIGKTPMDTSHIVTAAVGAAGGAVAKILIQSVVRTLRKKPIKAPLAASERSEILHALGRLENYSITQGNSIAQIDGTMQAVLRRLRDLEESHASLEARVTSMRSNRSS